MAVLSDLTVVAQTGSSPYDLTSIGRGVSVNDNGYVAFQGEALNAKGLRADNIFVNTGQSISQLMPSVFMYPNEGVDQSVAGTASIIEEVQINNSNEVLARRRLNASVQIGFPFGSIQTAPLTYLETWQAAANAPPSLPLSQVAMGLPAGASASLWFFINPVTGGVYPSPVDLGSPHEGLFRTATINNLRQVNYSAIVRGSGNARVSSTTSGSPILIGGIGSLAVDPMLADNGWYVFETSDGRIIAEPWALNAGFVTLAGSSNGFTAVSEAGISDDGRLIAFVGENTNTGRGLYVSQFDSDANSYGAVIKVLGLSGDGVLDPGETHDDLNNDNIVDVGEDVSGLSSLDLSNRVNINQYRSNYVVAFVGSDSTGKGGVYTASIDASQAIPRALAPIMLAGTGDTVPGVPGALSSFSLHDSVNNRGTVAFWATTSTGTEVVLKAFAPPPLAVVVVTHGLGNTWDAPIVGRFDPFGASFLDTWKNIGKKFEDLPIETSPLFEGVESYVADWSSSDGWFEAALSLVASLALVEFPFLSGLAAGSYVANLQESALNAEKAARTIVSDLKTSGLLTRPELTQSGTQVIQLVGHSRGGAVNARVAELLTAAGYSIEEYIALDGYSVDWTFPSNAFADIDINGTIGKSSVRQNVNNAVNYRVEDGLADFTFDKLGPAFDFLGQAILGPLAGSILTPAIKSLIRDALPEWQAPIRDNFDSNPTIVGDPMASNHLNVGPIYLESDAAASPDRRYILQSYVGQNSGRPTAEVTVGAASLAASVRFDDAGENVVLQGLNRPYGFADRDFESSNAFVEGGSAPEVVSHEEAIVRLWGQLVGNPAYALSTYWDVSGDAVLDVSDGDAFAELRTSGGASSISQLVLFSRGDRRIEFEVSPVSADASNEIVISIDDREVGRLAVEGLTAGVHSVELPRLLPDIGSVRFALVGDDDAMVQLDNLAIVGDPGDYDHDGSVNGSDFLVWQRQYGTMGDADADGNRDGAVDAADYTVWRDNYGVPPANLPGDYDNNRAVDGADFLVWQRGYGSTTDLAADGNRDGIVNAADYTIWRDNFGSTSSSQAFVAAAAAVTPTDVVLAISSDDGSQETIAEMQTSRFVADALRAFWIPATATSSSHRIGSGRRSKFNDAAFSSADSSANRDFGRYRASVVHFPSSPASVDESLGRIAGNGLSPEASDEAFASLDEVGLRAMTSSSRTPFSQWRHLFAGHVS